jgi:hypothetical protein
MTEHRIHQQPAPEEPVLAKVVELYPGLGRIVGVARDMQVGRGAVVMWPPEIPDNDEPPSAA